MPQNVEYNGTIVDGDYVDTGNYYFSGYVYDRSNGNPIEGVMVTLYVNSTGGYQFSVYVYTSGTGYFYIDVPYYDVYEIDYTKDGYVPLYTDGIDLRSNSNGTVQLVPGVIIEEKTVTVRLSFNLVPTLLKINDVLKQISSKNYSESFIITDNQPTWHLSIYAECTGYDTYIHEETIAYADISSVETYYFSHTFVANSTQPEPTEPTEQSTIKSIKISAFWDEKSANYSPSTISPSLYKIAYAENSYATLTNSSYVYESKEGDSSFILTAYLKETTSIPYFHDWAEKSYVSFEVKNDLDITYSHAFIFTYKESRNLACSFTNKGITIDSSYVNVKMNGSDINIDEDGINVYYNKQYTFSYNTSSKNIFVNKNINKISVDFSYTAPSSDDNTGQSSSTSYSAEQLGQYIDSGKEGEGTKYYHSREFMPARKQLEIIENSTQNTSTN